MDVTAFQDLISNYGFPIFVAVWMLLKNSKDSAAIKDALNELTTAIKLMNAGKNGESGESK